MKDKLFILCDVTVLVRPQGNLEFATLASERVKMKWPIITFAP